MRLNPTAINLTPLNHTHSPAATCWVPGAVGHPDFPVQNLPLAVFRRAASAEAFRAGVAIGDQVIDLAALAATALLQGPAQAGCTACSQPTLNDFMAQGPAAWQALRHALFALLQADSSPAQQHTLRSCLVAQSAVAFALPARIGDYTDFYTSIHHARSVGALVRPDDPMPPNFQWLPIAYHGRASSVVVSGTPFHRPMGQVVTPGAPSGPVPAHQPSARLDFELELGVYVGAGNAQGQAVPMAQAESHIFGVCLLNDWSARDVQFWEMTPLGPFLGKNFCTSVSPWVVSLEALAPFRQPFSRPPQDPQPLPYLDSPDHRARGALDIQLDVLIQTPAHRAQGLAGACVTRTSFAHQYWTLAQMVTQYTMGGCNLQPGDLIGTGTISGPTQDQAGALIELSQGGRCALMLAGTGEQRTFLQDGDTVVLRGWCEQPGAVRIGFGECRGTVLPARVSIDEGFEN